MPTLSAMFKLMDGYSSQINKMIERTDRAMTKMLGASKAADKVNDSMVKAGKGAAGAIPGIKGMGDGLDSVALKSQKADSGLKKLIGTVAGLAAAKKGMDLTDTYTNTQARLGMVTNSEAEREALQQDVFAAASRSRGDYTEMANAAAKLRMLAGDTFAGATGNQEAVAFTELLTKSLKVSGAGAAEQNSAFLQLTQAMTSGKLQGDEFRSVMENAPMVADAIASYMGKSKAELKDLSSEGVITADIIKGAMFQAADDINAKFDSMPPTFADTWQRIKNAGNQAFGGIFTRINDMLNSDMGQAVVNNLTGAIYLAAGAANLLLDGLELVGNNLDVIAPIAWGLVAAFTTYNIVLGVTKGLELASAAAKGVHTLAMSAQAAATAMQTGATFTATAAQYGFNAALMACPITWIVGLIILLVAAFYAGVGAVNQFTGATLSATGIIGGAIGGWAALVINYFIMLYNYIATVVNFFANVWNDPIAAVKVAFYDLAVTVIGYVVEMAKSIEAVINKIPGVEVSISAGLEDFSSKLESAAKGVKDKSGWEEAVKKLDFVSGADFANAGYNAGANLESKITGAFSGFNPSLDNLGSGMDYSQFATGGNPATVKGTGKGGAVKVENEEDIEWMRKLAERDYVARISQNTLAPNIRVEFSGPITKEADTDGVMAHVVEELKDIIATSPEGVPG